MVALGLTLLLLPSLGLGEAGQPAPGLGLLALPSPEVKGPVSPALILKPVMPTDQPVPGNAWAE